MSRWPVGRSRPLHGWRLLVGVGVLGLFAAYAVLATGRWFQPEHGFLVAFFGFFASLTGAHLASGLVWRSFTHLPVASGRVLAIVPVYEEDNARVHEVVWSMIGQTRPPDHIVVVDDGSSSPLVGFEHPMVTWIRQDNSGKRDAQVTALRSAGAIDGTQHWDFVFTVDSDSVLDADALEHLLRSMSWQGRRGTRVEAATGMIYTSNWQDNVLTKLTELNVGMSCMIMASLRSWLGIQTPTSGAIALYRAEIVTDNLDDYLLSGTMGDDRRLSFYGLLRGQVVRVNEAVASTHLPGDPRSILKQRSRWAKSAFLGSAFVATNFNPLINFFYFYPIVFAVIWPLVVVALTMVWVQTGAPALVYGVIFWWVVSLSMISLYVLYRPGFTRGQRVSLWFVGWLYPLFGLLLLRPAAYYALATLKDESWATRGPSNATVAHSNVVALHSRSSIEPVEVPVARSEATS